MQQENRNKLQYSSKNHTLFLSNKKEEKEKCGLILIKKSSIGKISKLVVSQCITGKVNILIPKKLYFSYLMSIFQNCTVII